MKELSRQLRDNKGQIRELLKESHGRVALDHLWWLLVNLLISQGVTSPDRPPAEDEASLHLQHL